jgi:hypothetical protein
MPQQKMLFNQDTSRCLATAARQLWLIAIAGLCNTEQPSPITPQRVYTQQHGLITCTQLNRRDGSKRYAKEG